MGQKWTMDLTGHVPGGGPPPSIGNHLVEIAKAETEAGTDKGNRVVVTYQVIKGVEPEDVGRTARDYLYVLDDDFSGSDGHAAVTKDNWYRLLRALGVKPGKFDAEKVARGMEGKRLGLTIGHRKATNLRRRPDETDEEFEQRKERVYPDVKAYFPADALASVTSNGDASSAVEEEDADDTEDTPSEDEFDLSDLT